MKTSNKVIVLAVALIGFGINANAQATTTATASATIVTPISIVKNVDMDFGNVAVTSSSGTVQLSAAASAVRTPGGGVTLPAVPGTVTAAKFTVSGEGSYHYDITIPTTPVTLDHGTDQMTADSWSCSITPTGGVLSSGTQVFYVGATLAVAAAQPAGLYVSRTTPFSVTVNYN